MQLNFLKFPLRGKERDYIYRERARERRADYTNTRETEARRNIFIFNSLLLLNILLYYTNNILPEGMVWD